MNKAVELIKASPTLIAVGGLVIIGVVGLILKSESAVSVAAGGLAGVATPAVRKEEEN